MKNIENLIKNKNDFMEIFEKKREIDKLKLEKEFSHIKEKSRQISNSLGGMDSFEIDDIFKKKMKTNKQIKVSYIKFRIKQISLVRILK